MKSVIFCVDYRQEIQFGAQFLREIIFKNVKLKVFRALTDCVRKT